MNSFSGVTYIYHISLYLFSCLKTSLNYTFYRCDVSTGLTLAVGDLP